MPVQTQVLTRSTELLPFLRLPQRVYAEDEAWVAPMQAGEAARLLHHGFTDVGQCFRLVLARRDGEVVGRCAVFRDPAHDQHTEENVVFFGYFEAIDDEAGRAVLGAAETQARAWQGAVLRGPRGITRIDARGILVDGHHLAPLLAGHHPRRYHALLEREGFCKHHDALAYEIAVNAPDGSPRPLPERLARAADRVRIPGLEVRGARWTSVLADLDLAHRVMVDAFRDVPDNTPLPRATFRALGMPFLGITHHEMLQLAIVDGEPAGFALCVPELNETLIHARGRLGPLGVARALAGVRGIKTASFKLLGLLPRYRRTGLHALLIREAIEGIRRAGYARLEASLIDERNKAMRNVVEKAGMTVYRRYRVYERGL